MTGREWVETDSNTAVVKTKILKPNFDYFDSSWNRPPIVCANLRLDMINCFVFARTWGALTGAFYNLSEMNANDTPHLDL